MEIENSRIQAANYVSGNWRIWTRLPRLAKLAESLFPISYNVSKQKKIDLLKLT